MTAEAEPAGAALPLLATARTLGAYVWLERALFEVVGGFAATDEVPAAVLVFDAWAGACGEHAELFAEQLPRLPGWEPAAVAVAPNASSSRVLDELRSTSGTLPRLVGLVRVVLPRLVAGYRAHLKLTVPVADANLARVLRLVVSDHTDALASGALLLGRLGATDAAALEAGLNRFDPLDGALASAGPGIVPLPDAST